MHGSIDNSCWFKEPMLVDGCHNQPVRFTKEKLRLPHEHSKKKENSVLFQYCLEFTKELQRSIAPFTQA